MITRAVMVSVTSVLLGEGSLTPLSTFNQISTLISVFFGCQHKNLCLSFCRWKAQLASALERFTEGLRHGRSVHPGGQMWMGRGGQMRNGLGLSPGQCVRLAGQSARSLRLHSPSLN